MGRVSADEGWCIIRTAGPRTLKLASSLAAAGMEVWTPQQTITKRRGRKRERIDVPAPITPTFVFARAGFIGDLIRAAAASVSPHPPFSVFRHRDRIPVITDRSLTSLRDAEAKAQRKHLKTTQRVARPGAEFKVAEGAFAGMTGIVEGSDGKQAQVNFGSGFVVTIATYLLPDDVIQSVNIAA